LKKELKKFKDATLTIVFVNKDERLKQKDLTVVFELEKIDIKPDLTFSGKFTSHIEIITRLRK
jgi:hypothetical protein